MRVLTLASLLLSSWFTLICAEDSYEEPEITERDRRHWAWQPIRRDLDGAIDSFLLKQLKAESIDGFAPRADDSTLLRRLHFTLTGLPPTPTEIDRFSYARFEETMEDLLSRPQYGEHWAQHWLDVARFAETDGFEHDKVREEAWRYRDWVIHALNRDLPYDQFLALQVAGDELPNTNAEDRFATGFLFAGPDMPDINLEEERRHNVLNEATGTLGSAFLGLTLSCAQCHDHKTDPISQADFYRLRAFFDNAKLPPKNKSLPPSFAEKGGKVSFPSILRVRGDFRRGGPKLEPAFLRIANPQGKAPSIVVKPETSGRRSAIAGWIRDPDNPLVARVIVNRVWMHHFGTGLVSTPNDFGRTGERPSHPDLLDWLADDFIEQGWSLKTLHRKILLSQAWQQTSRTPTSSEDPAWSDRVEFDPDNALLSRRTPLRLSGEVIRDAMLSATGELNLKQGGPGIRPPLPKEVTVTLLKGQWPVTEDEAEHDRRSIYLFLRRNLRYPFLDVFDKPDSNFSCGRRHQSTTAPQSLTLLNSEFSAERAGELSRNLSAVTEEKARIHHAFLLTLARSPSPEEVASTQEFLADASWEDFTLALFNLNEFVFLD